MILSFGSAAPVLAVPSAVALAGYVAAASLGEHSAKALRAALIIGWIAHALAIFADVSGIGSGMPGARFGFAPALSATVWLVLAVHAVESRFVPLQGVRRALALLGALVVALAWWFPGESRLHGGSPWEPLHWVLGIASYGLFGAAVLHASLLSSAERRMRLLHAPGAAAATAPPGGASAMTPAGGAAGMAPAGGNAGMAPPGGNAGMAPPGAMGLPLLRLEKLTFRFVAAGFAALSATLVLGWWFANPWRWDHKTVFSILGWVVFAGLLAGRQAFGWRGRRATGWLYAGAALLLLAYVGSRFVLEVLLSRGNLT
ncbi:MAG: cytochrome c biogenesis protein CcsA [Rhizobacter sp.]|nr:cytochrome c biogenesis protein CcsA [Rhizobacter sp.]